MIPSEAAQASSRGAGIDRQAAGGGMAEPVQRSTERPPAESGDRAIRLQSATWRDVFPIHRLEKRCFGEDAWPWIDVLGALSSPGAIHLKLTEDEQIVGYLIGERRSKKIGWIAAIAVDPGWRRRGLGAWLMSAAEAELGTECVRLSLRGSNQAAFHLYHKLGYRQVDRWTGYYRDGEDALIMEKVLDPDD